MVIFGLRTSYQVLVKCCCFVASIISSLSFTESYRLVLVLKDFCVISGIESGAVLTGETMSHFDCFGVSSFGVNSLFKYCGTRCGII